MRLQSLIAKIWISILFFNFSCSIEQPLSIQYEISIADAASQKCQVNLEIQGWQRDTLDLKMPKWMPGYYQLMGYSNYVDQFSASDEKGNTLEFEKINDNTWRLKDLAGKQIIINYTVKADKKFVANSYIDSTHAYLVTTGTFLYIDDYLDIPVNVKIDKGNWTAIATGLEPVKDKPDTYTAPDFDILYDCPLLIGDLESLPSFAVQGINHRFIGYDMGEFNRLLFMQNLEKVVVAASNIIGDIPYSQYTFIGIGKGRGGIEHLNNTTVSFSGNGLENPEGMNRMMNFLAHEYFHHYNVKRIRPFELGPFDYDKGNNTNLLWVSEGLSVYYEYLIVKRAGLSDEHTLLENFENNMNATENNPGKDYQSLIQASYATWKEGPFGTLGSEPGKSISYYQKGPLIGLLLDFEIRNATKNKKSLDDVMRYLYYTYYKKLKRGFTDAEFQQACERVAMENLAGFFEYVYTTREPDYNKYLNYAGLELVSEPLIADGVTRLKYTIRRQDTLSPLQAEILSSWQQ